MQNSCSETASIPSSKHALLSSSCSDNFHSNISKIFIFLSVGSLLKCWPWSEINIVDFIWSINSVAIFLFCCHVLQLWKICWITSQIHCPCALCYFKALWTLAKGCPINITHLYKLNAKRRACCFVFMISGDCMHKLKAGEVWTPRVSCLGLSCDTFRDDEVLESPRKMYVQPLSLVCPSSYFCPHTFSTSLLPVGSKYTLVSVPFKIFPPGQLSWVQIL